MLWPVRQVRMEEKRRLLGMVIAAAIRVHNTNAPGGYTVIPCWRHHMGYAVLRELCPGVDHVGAEEGFIDHRGEFLDRAKAFHHALDCGQLPAELRYLKAQRGEESLYSEDLY